MFCKFKKIICIGITMVVVFATVVFVYGGRSKTYAVDNQGRALGVDVSSYNANIDWATAKADGLDFAIIRIGYGDDLGYQDDAKARDNMAGCEAAGIPYGVYIYSYALSEKDVDSEIAHTLRMIEGYNPPLGIWFDMEDADNYKMRHGFNPYTHGEQLTNFCLRYVNGIKNAGFSIVGVYANLDYFTNVLDYDAISANAYIWYAHWGISEPKIDCAMWQYTNKGSVKGIPLTSEGTDMNMISPDSPLYALVATEPYEEPIEDPTTKPGQTTLYRGDVNGDGAIDIIDLAIIKKAILGKTTLVGEKATRADVNNDGSIDIIDLAKVKKHILNKINLMEK